MEIRELRETKNGRFLRKSNFFANNGQYIGYQLTTQNFTSLWPRLAHRG